MSSQSHRSRIKAVLTVQDFGDPDGDVEESIDAIEPPANESQLPKQSEEGNSMLTIGETALSSEDAPPAAEATTIADVEPQTASDIALPEIAKPVRPDLSVVRFIEKANHSAGKLVNLLAKHFPAFRDEARFDGQKVRFLKRAQIFAADIWAAFNGSGYGAFDDIGHLTMFAGE